MLLDKNSNNRIDTACTECAGLTMTLSIICKNVCATFDRCTILRAFHLAVVLLILPLFLQELQCSAQNTTANQKPASNVRTGGQTPKEISARKAALEAAREGGANTKRALQLPQGSEHGGYVTPKEFGCVADADAATGTGTDSAACMQAAIDYAIQKGTILVIDGLYRLTRWLLVDGELTIIGSGEKAGFVFSGSSDPWKNKIVRIASALGKSYRSHETIAAGATSLTLDGVDGLEVGDNVLLLLGTDPWDPFEEHLRLFAVVRKISGQRIFLNISIPETIHGTEHQIRKIERIAQNVTISNLLITQPTAATVVDPRVDGGISIFQARNVLVQNIRTDSAPRYLVQVSETENVILRNFYVTGSPIVGPATCPTSSGSNPCLSSGKVINGWGNRNLLIEHVVAQDVPRQVIYLESQNRDVSVRDLQISWTDNIPSSDLPNGYDAVTFTGGSLRCRVEKLVVSVPQDISTRRLIGAYRDSTMSIRDIAVLGSGRVLEIPLRRFTGELIYGGCSFSNRHTVRVPFDTGKLPITSVALPSGAYGGTRIYIDSTEGLEKFYLLCGSAGGDISRELRAGELSEIVPAPDFVGFIGSSGNYQFNENIGRRKTARIQSSTPVRGYIEVDVFDPTCKTGQ